MQHLSTVHHPAIKWSLLRLRQRHLFNLAVAAGHSRRRCQELLLLLHLFRCELRSAAGDPAACRVAIETTWKFT